MYSSQKKSQNGRSMVEMLLVIAIIALLSLGGIFTYKFASGQMKVQSVAKAIATLVKERQHAVMTARGAQKDERDVRGPYGLSIHIENGTEADGDRQKYFWLEIVVPEEGFRVELSRSDLIQANLVEIEEQTIRFLFIKNVSALEGSPTYTDEDGNVHACPLNAICDEHSFSCLAGHYKDDDSCPPCTGEKEYSDDGATACDSCGT